MIWKRQQGQPLRIGVNIGWNEKYYPRRIRITVIIPCWLVYGNHSDCCSYIKYRGWRLILWTVDVSVGCGVVDRPIGKQEVTGEGWK